MVNHLYHVGDNMNLPIDASSADIVVGRRHQARAMKRRKFQIQCSFMKSLHDPILIIYVIGDRIRILLSFNFAKAIAGFIFPLLLCYESLLYSLRSSIARHLKAFKCCKVQYVLY